MKANGEVQIITPQTVPSGRKIYVQGLYKSAEISGGANLMFTPFAGATLAGGE